MRSVSIIVGDIIQFRTVKYFNPDHFNPNKRDKYVTVPARILLIFSSVDLTDSGIHKYQGLKFWDENLRVEI